MATYTELVGMVRDWANRDTQVLSSPNIKTFINFAADRAYRTLRVPPLEAVSSYGEFAFPELTTDPVTLVAADITAGTVDIEITDRVQSISSIVLTDISADPDEDIEIPADNFTSTVNDDNTTTLTVTLSAIDNAMMESITPAIGDILVATYVERRTYNTLSIPSDAIEFIQLRKVSRRNFYSDYDVYAAKPDIRSFYQDEVVKSRLDGFWYTRDRNNLLVFPDMVVGDQFELYYYRRLPEADARYNVAAAIAAGDATLLVNTNTLDTDPMLLDTAADLELAAQYVTLTADQAADLTGFAEDDIVVGALVPNWLRQQNEKVLLFGALSEAFVFLNEPEQAQIYEARFMEEIDKLNMEDKMRQVMGGNLQVHYTSYLI